MSVALSRVAAFLPAGAPAIRWCPPHRRRVLSKRLRLKIIFMTLGMAAAISLDTHALYLCAVMAQRCSTAIS
eukprot:scaffold7831_cov108-Isochrysis_galbana.AAC.3